MRALSTSRQMTTHDDAEDNDAIAALLKDSKYEAFSFGGILDPDPYLAEEAQALVREAISKLNMGGLRVEIYNMARSIYGDPELLQQAAFQAVKKQIMVQEEVGRMAVLHVVGVEVAIAGAVAARYETNSSTSKLESLERQALAAALEEAKKGPVKNPMRPMR